MNAKEILTKEAYYKAINIVETLLSENEGKLTFIQLMDVSPKFRVSVYIFIIHTIVDGYGICDVINHNLYRFIKQYRHVDTPILMGVMPEIDKRMPKTWNRRGWAFTEPQIGRKSNIIKRKRILRSAIKELYEHFK